MPSPWQSLRRGRTAAWQALACLMVLSFLCRAMIPVGYMPDLSGGPGTFSITLCPMGGHAGPLPDQPQAHAGSNAVHGPPARPGSQASPGSHASLPVSHAHPDQPSPADHFGNPQCPFGMVASQAMVPGQQPAAIAVVALPRAAVQPHRSRALPPLPALGPPLGPRAPPARLA